jgi:hypothetical protein
VACSGNKTRDMVKRNRERVVKLQVMIGRLEEGHCAKSASAGNTPCFSPLLCLFLGMNGATDLELKSS